MERSDWKPRLEFQRREQRRSRGWRAKARGEEERGGEGGGMRARPASQRAGRRRKGRKGRKGRRGRRGRRLGGRLLLLSFT